MAIRCEVADCDQEANRIYRNDLGSTDVARVCDDCALWYVEKDRYSYAGKVE